MQEAGMIQYDRGCIIVPDRKKMESHVCECYSMVKNNFDRLLPRSRNFGEALPGATQQLTQADRHARRSRDTHELIDTALSGALTQRRRGS
jgi:hypothetical protein